LRAVLRHPSLGQPRLDQEQEDPLHPADRQQAGEGVAGRSTTSRIPRTGRR
jgi:hypothetical protein